MHAVPAAPQPTSQTAPRQPGLNISSNELGMILLIITETMLFSGLISSFYYIRGGQRVWPPMGAGLLSSSVPAVATAVIAASSVALAFSQISVRRNDMIGVRIGLVLALLMAVLFLASMIHEWVVTDITLNRGVFGGTFFLLTGTHMTHVVVGICFLANALTGNLKNRYTPASYFGITAAGMYWHFVTIVWMVLYPVIYLY